MLASLRSAGDRHRVGIDIIGMRKRAKDPAERLLLAEEYSRVVRISDDHVDADEVASIVRAATAVPNGWKVILARCTPFNFASKAFGHMEA